MSPRPLTCQMHVSPGMASSLLRSERLYSATSLGTGGRGPTKDISPFSTHHNCGSSSMLNLRMIVPIQVTLGSFFILKVMLSSWSLCSSMLSFNSSAFITIDRNFGKGNSFPQRPIRVCQKKTGPPSVNFMQRATPRKRGHRQRNRMVDARMSIIRLTAFAPPTTIIQAYFFLQ